MPLKSETTNNIITFNKHGLHLRWPRAWIIIIGVILILLCLIMAGMEVGHVINDLRRSTAFGGFILFIPLLICAIFVLITACKPSLLLLRIAIILCCIMIILCMLLIAYDVLVLIDPTRCFFLNCGDASVTYQANSTYNATISGWPLYISWPAYFQTEMNAKRIFQSIQLLCAGLFILFCALYILTFMIYRHIKLHQQSMYTVDHRTVVAHETVTTPPKHIHTSPKHINTITESHSHHLITTYTIEGRPHTIENRPYTSTIYNHSPVQAVQPVTSVIVPKKSKKKAFVRQRASSVDYNRICTRCMKEPRMILMTNFERQNFFSHLCVNCNNELFSDRRKPSHVYSPTNRSWKP